MIEEDTKPTMRMNAQMAERCKRLDIALVESDKILAAYKARLLKAHPELVVPHATLNISVDALGSLLDRERHICQEVRGRHEIYRMKPEMEFPHNDQSRLGEQWLSLKQETRQLLDHYPPEDPEQAEKVNDAFASLCRNTELADAELTGKAARGEHPRISGGGGSITERMR